MSDYTYVSETTPIARKTHQCGLCEEDIAKGEPHVARVRAAQAQEKKERKRG